MLLIGASFAIYLIFISLWRNWHGGWSWRPRYLLLLLPLMFVPITGVWESAGQFRPAGRAIFFLLTGVSILAQFVGAAVNYVETEFVLEGMPGLAPDVWFYRGKEALFNPALSPLAVQTRLLLQGRLDWSWVQGEQVDAVALLVVIGALILGGAALRIAVSSRPAGRMLSAAGLGLLFCAGIVVVRATARMPDRLRDDGRMEALRYVAAHWEPGDGLISDSGFLYELILDEYPRLPPAYIPPAPELAQDLLHNAISRHSRLWFVGGYVILGDPARWVEPWLIRNAFPIQTWEFGFHHLALFSTLGEELLRDDHLNARAGDVIRLKGFALSRGRDSQKDLQLTLYWEALRSLEQDYRVFVHVYNRNGEVVAQADHAPAYGLQPTFAWRPGEVVIDRIAIPSTSGLKEGDFTLAVGLYDGQSPAERLSVCTADSQCSEDGRIWLVGP